MIATDSEPKNSPSRGPTPSAAIVTWLAAHFDCLIERIDALGEGLLTPLGRFAWSLTQGTTKALIFLFVGEARAIRIALTSLRNRKELRVLLSPYADAIGSLTAITGVAVICSAPLLMLAEIGFGFLPPSSSPRSLLTIARLLVELGFYYPLLTIGVGCLLKQRQTGVPIQPSKCIRGMLSDLATLARAQGSIAAVPLASTSIALLANAQRPGFWANAMLALVFVTSLLWLSRNLFVIAPSLLGAPCRARSQTRTIGRPFLAFVSVVLGVYWTRIAAVFIIDRAIDCGPSWSWADPCFDWAALLAVRLVDPLVCIALSLLVDKSDDADSKNQFPPNPQGRKRLNLIPIDRS